MAAGVTIKHKRKAGAFVDGELSAGEWGLDVTGGVWYFSRNGTTVETMSAGGIGDMTESEFATNGATGKVDTAVNAEKLGDVVAANYATKTYADNSASAAAAAVVDASPAALNTLNELAAAMGDDANFATTMTNALAGKANTSHTHSGADITSGTMNNSAITIDGGTI